MLRSVRLGLERLEERETPSIVVPGSDPSDPTPGGVDPAPPSQSPTDPAPPTGGPLG